ncbi:MAG: DUF4422 domain-containing protein [Victivallaceae bacterium]|nr:DUF4422 domain-containing protein [Victivallaceae bacterium]
MDSASGAIMVCTHRNGFIYSGPGYMPIHCGRKISNSDLGIAGDDSGDNISYKNRSYCELTAVYWAWKNLKATYIGLCHYRRYFDFSGKQGWLQNKKTITEEEFSQYFCRRTDWVNLMAGHDVILPFPHVHSTSIEHDYAILYNGEDYKTLRKAVRKVSPEYIKAFETVSARNFCSYCNMFVMSGELFNTYCEWLFKVLPETELLTHITHYNPEQMRIYGFMGERLLNVFVVHHKLKIKYYPIIKVDNDEADYSLIKRFYARAKAELSFFFMRPHFYNN